MVLSALFVPADTLTIDQAIAIAAQNSFAIKNADATVRSNEQKVREAKGALGPRIATNYNYVRFGQPQRGNLGGQEITFVPIDTNTWTSQLTMPIDIVGFWSKNKKGAEAGVEASRNTRTAAENDLRQSVRKAYLQALRTKNLVRVAEQGQANIQAQVDVAEKKLREGAIARIDLERLKAQKAAADSDVLNARNNHTVAKQVLNLQLARPIETEFDVADVAAPTQHGTGLEKLVDLGQQTRPEVYSFRNTVKALDAAKTVAGQGLLPSLNLSIQNQQALDPEGFNPVRETNTTSLALSIPLYDSGIARAKRAQTEEQIYQTTQQLAQIRLGISQEVRTALTTMENAQARRTAANEQLRLANEVARIARVRRDAGEGTVLEIIDAETTLVNARNAVINAEFDYYAAHADLQHAIGADDIDAALRAYEASKAKGDKKK
jgi:outer membrane protein TolC